MSNIFICGYENKAAKLLKEFIDDLMREIGLENDAITSVMKSDTRSCDGEKEPRPYLWVRGTSQEEIFRVIEKFKETGLRQDVEWDVIGGFIPADEMLLDSPTKPECVQENGSLEDGSNEKIPDSPGGKYIELGEKPNLEGSCLIRYRFNTETGKIEKSSQGRTRYSDGSWSEWEVGFKGKEFATLEEAETAFAQAMENLEGTRAWIEAISSF